MNKAFEKIIDELKQESIIVDDDAGHRAVEIINQISEEYNGGWIPIKTRPMTEEEREYYSEFLDEDNGMIYECPLPDDEQEVLITTKYGHVEKTTFYQDGCYFEEYEDYDDVIAWQPLLNPYKENENL